MGETKKALVQEGYILYRIESVYLLGQLGYEVEGVSSLRDLPPDQYDLIVTDMDCSYFSPDEFYDFVREVKKQSPTTMIIVVSINNNLDVVRENMEAGVDVYFQYPYHSKVFKEVVCTPPATPLAIMLGHKNIKFPSVK